MTNRPEGECAIHYSIAHHFEGTLSSSRVSVSRPSQHDNSQVQQGRLRHKGGRQLPPICSDEVLETLALALVLDLKSLTIGFRIITLLFVTIQWNRIRELEQKTFVFTLLLTWIKCKFYYNIRINTHCWLPVNIYVIKNDDVLVRNGLDVGLDLDL